MIGAMEPVFGPLPIVPTVEMRAAFDVLRSDDRYPLPTTQAALWAVLAGYADDPVAWAYRLVELSNVLIDGGEGIIASGRTPRKPL